MDEKLQQLIAEARSLGATDADIAIITDRYNQSMQSKAGGASGTQVGGVDNELNSIINEARSLGATDADIEIITKRFNDKKKSIASGTQDGGITSQTESSQSGSTASVSTLQETNNLIPTQPIEGLDNNKAQKQAAYDLQQLDRARGRLQLDVDRKVNTILSRYNSGIDKIATQQIPNEISYFLPQMAGKTFGEVANSVEGKLILTQLAKSKVKDEIGQIELSRLSNLGAGNALVDKLPTELSSTDKRKISEKKKELNELEEIEAQLSSSRVSTDVDKSSIEAVIRTDQSGNALKRFVNTYAKLGMPLSAQQLGISGEATTQLEQLPEEFSIGLEYLSYKEPVEAKRVLENIANGKPISSTQKANIIAIGLGIVKDRLGVLRADGELTEEEYISQLNYVGKKFKENLLNSDEVLRADMSSFIAEEAEQDAIRALESIRVASLNRSNFWTDLSARLVGFRWNYSDDEIQAYAEMYARKRGLDINDARVKAAIKYLQDNEGAFIGSNSIYKSGWIRDFGEGFIKPVEGTLNSIEALIPEALGGLSNEEIYAKSKSLGSVQVVRQPTEFASTGVNGVMSTIFKGAGQFASQVLLTRGYGGFMSNALRQGTKDVLATTLMAVGQSYESNLQQALSYTDNDAVATSAALLLSLVEGGVENIKTPQSVARQIQRVFRSSTSNKAVIDILSNDKIINKEVALKDYLRGAVRGGIEATKIAGSEMIEESLTQLVDYVVNAVLNPSSESFQNRNLGEELFATISETGLTMVVPALLGGIGAGSVNKFTKGALLLAAQNRQKIIDDLDRLKYDGKLTQDEYNEKVSILNSVAKVNDNLPLKINGEQLNTEEKSDYIYSRILEGALTKKIEATEDAAEIEILKSKIKAEQEFRKKILQNENAENTINETEQQTSETTTPETEVINTEVATPTQDAEVVVPNISDNTSNVLSRVDNREAVNENELFEAALELEQIVETSNDPSVTNLITPLINKILSHDNITTTEISEVTQEGAVTRVGTDVPKTTVSKRLDQWQGNRIQTTNDNGEQISGTLQKNDAGNYVVLDESGNEVLTLGEAAITDRDVTLPESGNAIEFDENGNVSAINLQLNTVDMERGVTVPSRLVRLEFADQDQALDYAIQLRAEQIGEFSDAEFEQIIREVRQEVPIQTISQQQTQGGQNAIQEQEPTQDVLGDQRVRGEGGLQEVGEGNQTQEPTQQGQETQTQEVIQNEQIQPTEGISTTEAVSEPIQQNEPTTEEQGNQETVQQGTERVGGNATETTTAVLEDTEEVRRPRIPKRVMDAIEGIVGTGEVNSYISGKTVEKWTGETPTNDQSYTSTVLEDSLKQGRNVIEAAKNEWGDKYVSKLLDYLAKSNISVAQKALIYVSLRNDLYERRLMVETDDDYNKVLSEQEAVYAASQAFAHEIAVGMGLWRLQDLQKYGFSREQIMERLLTYKDMESRKKVEQSVSANDDEVNKVYDSGQYTQQVTEQDAKKDLQKIKQQSEEQLNEKKNPKRKKSKKGAWVSKTKDETTIKDMVEKLKERINKLNCK